MLNLKFIEFQPRWRVAAVALFAKLMGVLIHVEGAPFGSNRSRKSQTTGSMGETAASGQASGQLQAQATQAPRITA
jgi:hypothetical protein